MDFLAVKDDSLIPFVLSQILDSCVNGITLSDPDQEDNPLVYVNEAFCLMTGYSKEESLGRNCRFLQGEDHDQAGIEEIKRALTAKVETTVTLRNYRKDGKLFYNQFSIRPLVNQEGQLIYYPGIQYDVTDQVEAEEELERLTKIIEAMEKA